MRVLVTGGLGFIGSNFIKYYHTKHPLHQIINLDKKTYAASDLALEDLAKIPNYRLVIGDVCSKELVFKLTEGVDRIVHFAAETHVDNAIQDPFPFANTNITGTLVLLNAAVQNHVRVFHHVSTDEVFGSLKLESTKKFSETTCYAPRNPYSASKASSDHYVRSFHSTYGLDTRITNCSNNFGPYQHREKLIPKAILNILSNQTVPIYGRGQNVRDWLYVEDHCAAIDLCLEKGAPGESYCISAGNEYSNLEVVRMVAEAVKQKIENIENYVTFVEERKGHDERYALDSSKIRDKLGWAPRYGFEESLKRTVEWYRQFANKQS
jgi:dTDP-glucose 4,6-dehydratase